MALVLLVASNRFRKESMVPLGWMPGSSIRQDSLATSKPEDSPILSERHTLVHRTMEPHNRSPVQSSHTMAHRHSLSRSLSIRTRHNLLRPHFEAPRAYHLHGMLLIASRQRML